MGRSPSNGSALNLLSFFSISETLISKNPSIFLYICYSIFLINLLITGLIMELNNFFYLFLIIVSIQMYYFQINKLKIKDSLNCLKIFKSNNMLGLLIFISLIIGKL